MNQKKMRIYLKTHDAGVTVMTVEFDQCTVMPGFLKMIKQEQDCDCVKLIPMKDIIQCVFYNRNDKHREFLNTIDVCLKLQPLTQDHRVTKQPETVCERCSCMIVYPDSFIIIKESSKGKVVKIYAVDQVITASYQLDHTNVLYGKRGFINDACDGYDL